MLQEPFSIERTYNASAEQVWKAITDKDEMTQRYFELSEFKTEVGFESGLAVVTKPVFSAHMCA